MKVLDIISESLRTENPCWKGYKPVGTKKKGGKTVPNCVPESEDQGENELSEEFDLIESIDHLWAVAEEKATEIVMREAKVSHIPEEKRVRRFIIKRDNEIINQMHQRVIDARNIFDELIEII